MRIGCVCGIRRLGRQGQRRCWHPGGSDRRPGRGATCSCPSYLFADAEAGRCETVGPRRILIRAACSRRTCVRGAGTRRAYLRAGGPCRAYLRAAARRRAWIRTAGFSLPPVRANGPYLSTACGASSFRAR